MQTILLTGLAAFCCSQDHDNSVQSVGLNFWQGGIVLAVWLAVLIVTLVLNVTLQSPPLPLQWWVVFYRTGSIIYGGGQVSVHGP